MPIFLLDSDSSEISYTGKEVLWSVFASCCAFQKEEGEGEGRAGGGGEWGELAIILFIPYCVPYRYYDHLLVLIVPQKLNEID